MNSVNPTFVLRDFMSQIAIDTAYQGNHEPIEKLFQIFKKPYDKQPEYERWFAKRRDWARDKVGNSMLSCSS